MSTAPKYTIGQHVEVWSMGKKKWFKDGKVTHIKPDGSIKVMYNQSKGIMSRGNKWVKPSQFKMMLRPPRTPHPRTLLPGETSPESPPASKSSPTLVNEGKTTPNTTPVQANKSATERILFDVSDSITEGKQGGHAAAAAPSENESKVEQTSSVFDLLNATKDGDDDGASHDNAKTSDAVPSAEKGTKGMLDMDLLKIEGGGSPGGSLTQKPSNNDARDSTRTLKRGMRVSNRNIVGAHLISSSLPVLMEEEDGGAKEEREDTLEGEDRGNEALKNAKVGHSSADKKKGQKAATTTSSIMRIHSYDGTWTKIVVRGNALVSSVIKIAKRKLYSSVRLSTMSTPAVVSAEEPVLESTPSSSKRSSTSTAYSSGQTSLLQQRMSMSPTPSVHSPRDSIVLPGGVGGLGPENFHYLLYYSMPSTRGGSPRLPELVSDSPGELQRLLSIPGVTFHLIPRQRDVSIDSVSVKFGDGIATRIFIKEDSTVRDVCSSAVRWRASRGLPVAPKYDLYIDGELLEQPLEKKRHMLDVITAYAGLDMDTLPSFIMVPRLGSHEGKGQSVGGSREGAEVPFDFNHPLEAVTPEKNNNHAAIEYDVELIMPPQEREEAKKESSYGELNSERKDFSSYSTVVTSKPFGMSLDQDLRVISAKSPADKEGIMCGDRLEKIAGQSVTSDSWKKQFFDEKVPFALTMSRPKITIDTMLDIIKQTLHMPFVRSRWHRMKSFGLSFHGNEYLSWLMESKRCKTRCEAEGLASCMVQCGLIRRVDKPHDLYMDNRDLHQVIPLEKTCLCGPEEVSFEIDDIELGNDEIAPTSSSSESPPPFPSGSRFLVPLITGRISELKKAAESVDARRESLPPLIFQALTTIWVQETRDLDDPGSVGCSHFIERLSMYFGEAGDICPRRLFWCLADGATNRVSFETWLNAITLWEKSSAYTRLKIIFDIFDRSQTGYLSRSEVKDLVLAVTKKRRSCVSAVVGNCDALLRFCNEELKFQLESYISFFPNFFAGIDADMDDKVSMEDLWRFLEIPRDDNPKNKEKPSHNGALADVLSKFVLPIDTLYMLRC